MTSAAVRSEPARRLQHLRCVNGPGGVKMNSWDLVRCFLALHRTGGYEAAGQMMGLDHSTMRRKIQALELMLGSTLFVRRDGRFYLRDGNEVLLEAALKMEASSTLFAHYSEAAGRGGLIRISTLDIFANLLAPDLVAFSLRHPDLCLHVTTEPHFVDLEREAVDIAIRLARPTKGSHGLKRLCSLRFCAFHAPSYRAERGASHKLLTICAHFNHSDHDFELADQQWSQKTDQIGDVVGSADTYSVLLRLCEEGLGLAMLPRFLTAGTNLLPLDGMDEGMEVDVWIVIRKDVAHSAKIRLVLDFLTQAFQRHRPRLESRAGPTVAGARDARTGPARPSNREIHRFS